jgi:hypothetical protein
VPPVDAVRPAPLVETRDDATPVTSAWPTVSVIVPTVDRASLRRALASAASQTLPPTELVVVHDRPRPARLSTADPLHPDVVLGIEVRHLWTGGGAGPAVARTTGVSAAHSELVAFLGEDDVWDPQKLEVQLSAARDAGADGLDVVVLSGATWIADDGGVTRVVSSGRRPGDRVDQSLFARRHFWHDDRIYGGSVSMVCPRALLERHPLDASLHRHEDWDWLLRVSADPAVEVVVVPQSLVRCRRSIGIGSTSSTPGVWWEAVAFAEDRLDDPRVLGDFLLVEAASTALDHGARRDAAAIAWRAVRGARPHRAAMAVFLANAVVPRPVRRWGTSARRSRAGLPSRAPVAAPLLGEAPPDVDMFS